jgi:putative transcriptional regulator
MMQSDFSLNGQFLIASPGMMDPHFSRTVTLVCEHSEEGAMGIVINRLAPITMGEIFEDIKLADKRGPGATDLVYQGGPVQPDRGFILHTGPAEWDSSLELGDGLYLTTSRDILQAIARDEGPREYRVALGYSGWGSGQLEHEISENAWLSCPIDKEIIFSTNTDQQWFDAGRLLGIDITQLSSEAGHA